MFDVVINNGTLVDPELKTSFKGSLGIKDGKLTEITTGELVGIKNINASGLIVSPGFIDIHGHVDGEDYCGELSLRQGITTTIGGNCGLSPINMNTFFDKQDKKGFVINQAELVGHSMSLRQAVGITDVYSAANKEQISKMQYLTEKALCEGACGLSLGLEYAPYSSLEEIYAICIIAAKHNRPITIHTRASSDHDLNSIREAIEISRVTGALVLISHFVYQYNAVMDKALEIVDKAIEEGLNIKIDSGLYNDWATSIGTAIFCEKNVNHGLLCLNKMLVASGKYKGERLNNKLYKELRAGNPCECIIYCTDSNESVYKALDKSYAMPSSDTGPYKKGEGHPQISGTFPRYFRYMVRERKEISLIEAVRKATFLPAETMGLKQKGRIKKGTDADVVIFDIDTIKDKSDFPDVGVPDRNPEGIKYVFVNGRLVLDGEIIQNSTAGRTIRTA
ncbi:amidohydrolase family protein [Clostridium estertheticum]|uniref:N-acyl-D-amino-acid deacylase family protein n=1 Tax=Clostridium estertheticum TaxID=238834 RepID=UPI001C0E6721|nr:amidohydrolase family protein [Clostridium estertheticum]MBU3177736.1 amidohydrolase family protein [Clostridium estertheticum]